VKNKFWEIGRYECQNDGRNETDTMEEETKTAGRDGEGRTGGREGGTEEGREGGRKGRRTLSVNVEGEDGVEDLDGVLLEHDVAEKVLGQQQEERTSSRPRPCRCL